MIVFYIVFFQEPNVEYVPLPTPEDRALMKEKLKQQKIDEKRKFLEERESKKEEMRRQIEAEKMRRKEEKDKVSFIIDTMNYYYRYCDPLFTFC